VRLQSQPHPFAGGYERTGQGQAGVEPVMGPVSTLGEHTEAVRTEFAS
jgi:hypothetical protein